MHSFYIAIILELSKRSGTTFEASIRRSSGYLSVGLRYIGGVVARKHWSLALHPALLSMLLADYCPTHILSDWHLVSSLIHSLYFLFRSTSIGASLSNTRFDRTKIFMSFLSHNILNLKRTTFRNTKDGGSLLPKIYCWGEERVFGFRNCIKISTETI